MKTEKSIKDHIETLQSGFDGCICLALADLSTRTVLCASSRERLPQERLDALCAAAAELLTSDPDATPQVRVMGIREQICFRLTARDGTEALLAICDIESSAQEFMDECAAVVAAHSTAAESDRQPRERSLD